MKQFIILNLVVFMANTLVFADAQRELKMYVIPSWGDMTLVYGPETNADNASVAGGRVSFS